MPWEGFQTRKHWWRFSHHTLMILLGRFRGAQTKQGTKFELNDVPLCTPQSALDKEIFYPDWKPRPEWKRHKGKDFVGNKCRVFTSPDDPDLNLDEMQLKAYRRLFLWPRVREWWDMLEVQMEASAFLYHEQTCFGNAETYAHNNFASLTVVSCNFIHRFITLCVQCSPSRFPVAARLCRDTMPFHFSAVWPSPQSACGDLSSKVSQRH